MSIEMPRPPAKWIVKACEWLNDHLEPPDEPMFLSPAEWKLIRDREPVGGASDATEILRERIARYNRTSLQEMICAIRDGNRHRVRAIIAQEQTLLRMYEECRRNKGRKPKIPP